MGKVITILAIVAAFVAGTIVAGTAVDAAQGDNQGKPFQELLDQIQTEIVALELRSLPPLCIPGEIAKWDGSAWNCAPDDVDDADNDPTNELQTLSGVGSVDLSDSGGSVPCIDITGGAGLCDGVDDDTQYDGTDFATSGQSCDSGQVVVGIDANGNLICESAGSSCLPSTEVCDGLDNDCDNSVDEDFAVGDSCGLGACAGGTFVCSGLSDAICSTDDQSTSEVCDGIDNDCDGTVDEEVSTTFYQDADGDGFGNAAASTQACSAPAGFVTDNTDCDDTNAQVNPVETEILGDGLDNDCDGTADPVDIFGTWSLSPTLAAQCNVSTLVGGSPAAFAGTVSLSEVTITQVGPNNEFSTELIFDFLFIPPISQEIDFASEPVIPYPSFSVSGDPVSLSGTFTSATTFDGLLSVSAISQSITSEGFDIDFDCDAINSQAFTATKQP